MIKPPPDGFRLYFWEIVKMTINEKEITALGRYIAEYLAEENIAEIDSFLVMDAIDAYIGGAADTN